MSKIWTQPAAPVDEVTTGEIASDILDASLTVIHSNVFIRDTVDPTAAQVLQKPTNIDAARLVYDENAIEALDNKVVGMEISSSASQPTPSDSSIFGYFYDGTDWAQTTWLSIRTFIASTVSGVAAEIHAAIIATTVADDDEVGFVLSPGWLLRRITFANVKATLKTYFDAIYQPLKPNLTTLGLLSNIANIVAIANLSIPRNRAIIKDAAGNINTTGVWIKVMKTADEQRPNNNTVSLDGALKFNMLANTKYAIRGQIFYNTTSAADFRYKFYSPASPTIYRGITQYVIPGSTVPIIPTIDVIVPAGNTDINGTGTGGAIHFDIIIQNVTAGQFGFGWAQRVVNAAATKTFAGCYLEYMIIG